MVNKVNISKFHTDCIKRLLMVKILSRVSVWYQHSPQTMPSKLKTYFVYRELILHVHNISLTCSLFCVTFRDQACDRIDKISQLPWQTSQCYLHNTLEIQKELKSTHINVRHWTLLFGNFKGKVRYLKDIRSLLLIWFKHISCKNW